MAVMATAFDPAQRETLEALCETFVPAVEVDSLDPVELAFMRRSAADMHVHTHMEAMLAQAMTPEELAGVGDLLNELGAQGLGSVPMDIRTQIVHGVAAADPLAKLGLRQLKGLCLLLFYGIPDAHGQNPNWEALGYPGPVSAPPSPEEAPKTLALAEVTGEQSTLTCDVVVVGSGAGGSVIAARAAAEGRSVLVLEAGAYRNEQDFNQLELPGYQELFYGAGLAASEDASISILAGATLGGGTVVNYMNCIPTPQRIVEEWSAHGLTGMEDFEAYTREHVQVVLDKLNANTEATRQNGTHQRLMAGLDAMGLEHRPIVRNVTLDDDPEMCGYCTLGCQKGCKRSALKTWLQDASDAGAQAVVGCHADRILVEDGRAAGVECTVTGADGATTALTVEATDVIVACGSIESPGLLLRSGIGGPAVGKHLRLHPAYIVMGVYDEPVEGWRGQIQSLVSDAYEDIEGDHGFLIEATGMFPGLVGSIFPWEDGFTHKQLMQSFRWQAPFISVARDHGSGEVVLDPLGRPVVRWGLGDEVDRRMAQRANVELCRLHQAAGASQVFTAHSRELRWRQGDDFDDFLARVEAASYDANDVACFTAHQMGSCRMGTDPAESVADGRGELHDVKGVWIGDASAFPTAPGVNPMVSIMALAHRTADELLGTRVAPGA
jgi:choline dehydrogenase-like flavoprotein